MTHVVAWDNSSNHNGGSYDYGPVGFDATPPTLQDGSLTPAPETWHNAPFAVSWQFADPLSGVNWNEYSIDQGASVRIGGASGSAVISADGRHCIQMHACDNTEEGNISGWSPAYYYGIDRDPPIGPEAVTPAPGWHAGRHARACG